MSRGKMGYYSGRILDRIEPIKKSKGYKTESETVDHILDDWDELDKNRSYITIGKEISRFLRQRK